MGSTMNNLSLRWIVVEGDGDGIFLLICLRVWYDIDACLYPLK